MQAYVLTRYGATDVMEMLEVPEPIVADGELLIKVHAAGLNPVDYKMREGKIRPLVKLNLPIVAGSELSGVVLEAGAGVSGFNVGDRVFARVDKTRLGAFAPLVTVASDLVAKMPVSLSFEEAASLPLAGETALQVLRDELAMGEGKKVFISGGAGGVGTLAIQIAKWMGAYVATTASTRGADLVQSLGADEVIDYKTQRFVDILQDYDGAFDLIGGQDLIDSFAILKSGSTSVSISAIPEPGTAKDTHGGPFLIALFWLVSARVRWQARKHAVRYRFLFMRPSGSDLAQLAQLVDEGHLRVTVDRVFSFAEISEAFAYLEQGRAKGKIVVRMEP